MTTQVDKHELLKALAAHAKTLGWCIEEWEWKDDVSGYDEYTIYVRPTAAEVSAP